MARSKLVTYTAPVALGRKAWWVFRDRFLSDIAAGSLDSTAATPGAGNRTVTDVESQVKTLGGRLRGLTQPTSAAWGEAKVVWPSQARTPGRALAAVILAQDAGADLAFGWASAGNIGDPTADGHGWLSENGDLQVITPGVKVILDAGRKALRPVQYLAVLALNDQGALVLLSSYAADSGGGMVDALGIPQYPTARILYVDSNGTTDPMFPYVSGYDDVDTYPNGHSIEDVRVVDVASWSAADFLAATADRFTRADSAASLGGSWIADAGTWGISSNKAYLPNASGFVRAALADALPTGGDGIVVCDITPPTNPAGTAWGLVVRRQDANNFIRLWNNFTSTRLDLAVWEGGAHHAGLGNWAPPGGFTAGQTYRVVLAMSGNKYKCWINGSDCSASTWTADADSHFITERGVGLYSSGNGNYTETRWDNLAVYPHTVTLPAELQQGKVPTILTGGSTLASDTFTDSNGTRLNAHSAEAGGAWTEGVGTWTVQSNRASVSSGGALDYATQDVSASDIECSADIITPGSFATGKMRVGIIFRFVDASNYLYAHLFLDGATGEIELYEMVAGTGPVVHKLALPVFSTSTTYNLKVQAKGDLIQVLLDGKPRISYYTRSGSPLGTKHGIARVNIDDGCVFDNWVVKAL